MPTYDYICDACGHEFEAFESIKADPQTVCPTCHEAKLRRKIGPGAAILFKGSGFYQTDYRSESYKKGADGRQVVEHGSASSSTTTVGHSLVVARPGPGEGRDAEAVDQRDILR